MEFSWISRALCLRDRRWKDFLRWMVFAMLCSSHLEGVPVRSRSSSVGGFNSENYLVDFGYLRAANQETGELRNRGELDEAVLEFQKMAGIPQTGQVDRATIAKMQAPRCGMSDVKGPNDPQSFALGPSKWDRKDLTYSILKYTQDLYWQDARSAFNKAFRLWSEVSPLSFTEVNGKSDIEISFARGYHEDGYDFDGQGRVLAHAFPPGQDRGGDAHFDDDETWSLNSDRGTDLYTVAAHEFGHSLGIYHSNVQGALMYPWYQGYNPNLRLHEDDVRAIQTLYGKPTSGVTQRPDQKPPTTRIPPRITSTTTTRRPQIPDDGQPNPCASNVDAVTIYRGEIFAFKDQWFWRQNRNGERIDYPAEFKRFWIGLPSDLKSIDTVYQKHGKDIIVFFKGDRYWELKGLDLAPGFTKAGKPLTTLGLPDSLKKIDAAFVWGLNKRTYLFSGYSYWRMDESGLRVEAGYPKPSDLWKGIPVPFDTVYTHFNGETYFFQGTYYFAIDEKTLSVKEGYPKHVTELWRYCSTQIMAGVAPLHSKSLENVIYVVILAFVQVTAYYR